MDKETAFDKITKVDEVDAPIKTIKDTATAEGLKQLFSMQNISMKTDLKRKLILAMSRGDIFADTYNSEKMRSLIKYIEVRSISNDRKGRGELVALVRNSQEVTDFENDTISNMAKVLGK